MCSLSEGREFRSVGVGDEACTFMENDGEGHHREGSILAHGVRPANLEEEECSWSMDVS